MKQYYILIYSYLPKILTQNVLDLGLNFMIIDTITIAPNTPKTTKILSRFSSEKSNVSGASVVELVGCLTDVVSGVVNSIIKNQFIYLSQKLLLLPFLPVSVNFGWLSLLLCIIHFFEIFQLYIGIGVA